MKANDLRPYLGDSCYIRLHCRACGVAHHVSGELGRGRRDGEVLLEGQSYSVEDIEEVRRASQPEPWLPVSGFGLPRSMLFLIGLFTLFSTLVRLAHLH